jgi:hypothetical protein
MTQVHSSRLQFTGAGLWAVAKPDRAVIVDVTTGRVRHEVAAEGLDSVAVFADQLWTTTSSGPRRSRAR